MTYFAHGPAPSRPATDGSPTRLPVMRRSTAAASSKSSTTMRAAPPAAAAIASSRSRRAAVRHMWTRTVSRMTAYAPPAEPPSGSSATSVNSTRGQAPWRARSAIARSTRNTTYRGDVTAARRSVTSVSTRASPRRTGSPRVMSVRLTAYGRILSCRNARAIKKWHSITSAISFKLQPQQIGAHVSSTHCENVNRSHPRPPPPRPTCTRTSGARTRTCPRTRRRARRPPR